MLKLLLSYLRAGTGDIQTLTAGLAAGGTVSGALNVTGSLAVSGAFIQHFGGDTSGTPGAATINGNSGRFAIALGNSSVVITNAYIVGATSVVVCVLESNDTTAKSASVVPANGSFTCNLNAACTATCIIRFMSTT